VSNHDHAGGHHRSDLATPADAKTNRRTWWVFGGFAAIALVLLVVEHRAHVLGWLPWLFLIACPLMHLFMHGGHGHGGHGHGGHRGPTGRDDET